ncbi:MAG: DUF4351 domain-containing protein [Acidobacteriota bacterium]
MANGHDQLHKTLLETFIADYVCLLWPEAAKRIDLDSIRPEPTEGYLDTQAGRGRPRRPDLVAKLYKPGSTRAEAVLHIEIEKRYRATLAKRLAEYNRLLHHRHDRPVLTSALILRGGKPEVVAHSLELRVFGVRVNRFDYRTLGLSRSDASGWLARPEPLAWAYAALMHMPNHTRAKHRIACLLRIRKAWTRLRPRERFLLINCIQNYLRLEKHEELDYERILEEIGCREEIEAMELTWSDEIRAEGIQEGMCLTTISLLERKFGVLSSRVRQRIEAQSIAELEQLARRLLDADSLGDLGLA